MKANTSTWIALLLLTLTSFVLRDAGHGRSAANTILVLAGIKCAVLGWNYMELGRAHWFWQVALLAILATISLGGAALATT